MNNRYLLNIGLERSSVMGDGAGYHINEAVWAVAEALELHAPDATLCGWWQVESDTEPTACIEVTTTANLDRMADILARVSVELQQEAIAVMDKATGNGRLSGPMAHLWGDFNPEFFILPDGRRAAVALPLAA